MTASLARQIIAKFKTNVPSWPDIDWSMLYIEINDEGEVFVSPFIDGSIAGGQPFDMTNEKLDEELSEYICKIHQSIKELFRNCRRDRRFFVIALLRRKKMPVWFAAPVSFTVIITA